MMLMLSMFTVFGVDFNYEQAPNLIDYNTNNVGVSVQQIAVGSLNSYNIGNQTGDVKYELRGSSEPIYLIIENGYANSTFEITYVNDDPILENSSSTAYSQELTMTETGAYYFIFEPSYDGESFDFILDFANDKVHNVYLKEQQPQGFNSLMSGFVNAFLDIVEINITIWRVVFYTLIFIIMVAFVGLLFTGSLWMFKYSQKIRDRKGFTSERFE